MKALFRTSPKKMLIWNQKGFARAFLTMNSFIKIKINQKNYLKNKT